jgi:hypothetical protein
VAQSVRKSVTVDFIEEGLMSTIPSRAVPPSYALPSDPLAGAVHQRLEQLRREADEYRLVRDARTARLAVRSRRAASAWPTGVAAALRDSLSGRPVPASRADGVGAEHGPAACSA